MISVSDVVSAARVVEQENSKVESCCQGAGEILPLPREVGVLKHPLACSSRKSVKK